MEIIPKYIDIAVEENNMQLGCLSIDDTKTIIQTAYEDLEAVDEMFLSELTGDVKTAFAGASDTIEKQIRITHGIWGQLSVTLMDYTSTNVKINEDAENLAGGNQNE